MKKPFARGAGIALVLITASAFSPLTAQDRSAALAKELTGLLQQRKLDSVAARHPAAADQFVAALYFPGQLLVVWAKTSAPAIINEKTDQMCSANRPLIPSFAASSARSTSISTAPRSRKAA